MKSLMEEASSIGKAIEKGWTNAGKPQEFTIKIFEEPEKSFIGLTVRPAKIGIFFTEPTKIEAKQKRKKSTQEKVKQQKKIVQKIKEVSQEEPKSKKVPESTTVRDDLGPIWSSDMVETVQQWIILILSYMNLGDIPFTIDQDRFHLKIQFSKMVFPDISKQRYFFSSLVGLILTMLKRQYKRPLKGYKIVLTSEPKGENF